jgi:hypothetical protein
VSSPVFTRNHPPGTSRTERARGRGMARIFGHCGSFSRSVDARPSIRKTSGVANMPKSTDYSRSLLFLDNVSRKIFVVLWIFYVIAPLSGGFPWGRFLEYHWLPNESFDQELHEPLSSEQRCRTNPDEDVECVDVPNAWKDKETGKIYSADDFKQHRQHEAIRMLLPWSIYGLIGSCLAGVHAELSPNLGDGRGQAAAV